MIIKKEVSNIIIICLMLLIIGILGYMTYKIVFDGGDCVLNPVNYLQKQINDSDYICGCFPKDAIKQQVQINFEEITK